MRDLINVSITLENIVCHDEGDGWGSAEPYLWTVFFKIDGTTARLNDSLMLEGGAFIETTPGSHGNLGDTDVDAGDTVSIPSAIGQWSTALIPIPVPQWVKDAGTDDVAAVAGVICILMEEDNVTDSGAEAGHRALNTAVQSALDGVVNSLGFAHPEVTDDDIKALTDSIESKVKDAIKDSQNVFENIWSWLNADDTIGTAVFRFDQDTLINNGTTNLNQRWDNEGDWELNGNISASVACTSDQLRAVAEAFNLSFSSDSEKEMRAFRVSDFQKYPNLQEWWKIGARNIRYLKTSTQKDDLLLKKTLSVYNAMAKHLKNRSEVIDNSFWKSTQEITEEVLKSNKKNRQMRKDLMRILDVINVLRNKSFNQVIEMLNVVEPARHPKSKIGNDIIRLRKKDLIEKK